jgi:tetratricopeptide (TPR) repeat protein
MRHADNLTIVKQKTRNLLRLAQRRLALKIAVFNFGANMKLKRPQLVSQGSLNRILQAAEQAWHLKDFQQNIELLERASRLNPSNPAIFMQLGRMYGLRYDYANAERCFERALRVSPRRTEAMALVGAQCRDFRNPEIAGRYLRLAAEQKDATPEMLAELAELYERLRRVEDAVPLIERALRLNSASPLALLVRARLDRQAGRLDEAEKLLRAFPPNADRFIRIRAWYELGGIFDRQGRYDEAMSAFLEAKTLLKPDAAPLAPGLQVLRDRLKKLAENVTKDMFERWFDSGQHLQPPRRLALLGGHPRSGTTLLEQVLDSHPDIISAEETEVFHDEAYVPLTRGLPPGTLMLPVLEAAQTGALLQSRANYFRSVELALGKPVGSRLLIDKNPSLTLLIPALVRVFPEIKLIVALRDPRDVCLSCFMQPFFQLGQTSSAYLTLEGTTDEYAVLMGVWRAIAPLLKNLHIEVRYEDMVDDLESVARKTLDFLDVPWDERVLGFDKHAREKVVRSPTYADVARPVYKSARGRWRNYQKYLEPHLEKLEPFVKAFGYE